MWGKKSQIYFKRNALPAILLGIAGVSISCAQNGSLSQTSSTVTSCVLADDQVATLKGKWPALPVPVALQANGFDANETVQITAAMDTWNSFYSQTKGVKLINYSDNGAVRTSTLLSTRDIRTEQIVSGSDYKGVIVIYKQGAWRYDRNIIGLTTHYWTAGTPLSLAVNAMIEVNYADFFVSGKRIPDLQSIVLHELGHLIGLGHSCESGSSTRGVPDCNGGIPSTYSKALMFPVFGWTNSNSGEVKRDLRENDQGRANCLY